MAAKRLRRSTRVDGVWYGPGDEVPADVAGKITNPLAWEDAPQESGSADADPDSGPETNSDDGAPERKAPRKRTS